MPELSVRTERLELDGGQVLRVSLVDRPQGRGRDLVLERLPGSAGARSLMEPSTGDRLVVSDEIADDLVELVREVRAGD